jgi:WASH complex subunit strumpellin
LILIIKDGDIYDTSRNYVKPEHRSFALADQASLLYVLMFFVPKFLRDENAKMREIVDKHFYDNWVVPVFLGYLVDLSFEWKLYDAASRAIKNTVTPKTIQAYSDYYKEAAKTSVKIFNEKVLLEGYLSKSFVLNELPSLLGLIRNANTACRWLMLHRLSRNPDHRAIVLGAAKIQNILKLLIYAS